MSSTPVLALPNFRESFVVEMDACDYGIGAVLKYAAWATHCFSEKSFSRQASPLICLREGISRLHYGGGSMASLSSTTWVFHLDWSSQPVFSGRADSPLRLTIESDESSHGTSILHHIQKGARQYIDKCLVSAATRAHSEFAYHNESSLVPGGAQFICHWCRGTTTITVAGCTQSRWQGLFLTAWVIRR